MLRFLLRLLCNGAIFIGVSHLVPGFVVESMKVALIAAVVFGVVNAIIRPLLILISLPVTILTLGIFTLVIDAAVMGLTAYLVPGFEIHGFVAALLGWIIVSIGSAFVSWLLKND